MRWAEDFLKIYYWEDILSLATKWPDTQSLNVDLNVLSKCDLEKWELLSENPDQVISELEAGLKSIPIPIDVEWNPTVRICGIENPMRVRDIRTEKINKLITVSGLVQKISEVWPRITVAQFECQRCGYITELPQMGYKFSEPLECENEMCGRKGPFKLQVGESTMVDTQKLRLQESPEDLNGGEQPQTIDVQIDGDITGMVLPGNRVTITGILRAFQKTVGNNQKTTQFDMMLEGGYVSINETEMDLEITDEDRDTIQKMSKKNDVVDRLVEGFASSIYGYDVIKESLLAAAVSGGNILKPDGTIQRGYAHVVICGDPSTAKSTLLANVKQLIPRSQMATGDGSTRAGLTAAVVKDDFYGSKWSLEAGSLVLSDRSVAIIDELDKMRDEDVPKLNTVLSSSTIHINKAGINCTLWARCPVLCAMNPKLGRFDQFESIPEQVNIRSDTLSRFDLIFTMFDTPKPEIDEKITDILVGAWSNNHTIDINQIDIIRKYISIARQIKDVDILPAALDRIKSYYLSLRKTYNPSDDVVSITTRNLEALIRLTRSEAKLRLSTTADVVDVDRAIKLVKTSMRETSLDDSGKLDSSIVETGQSKSQRDRAKIIRDVIRELQKDGPVKFADIALRADDQGISSEQLEHTIKQMKREGAIFEHSTSGYRCV